MSVSRIVALEEHVQFSRFVAEVDPELIARAGYRDGFGVSHPRVIGLLDEVLGGRLRSMDEAGITVQVLSVVGPGADILPPETGPAFARRYNDEVARLASERPDRFAGFAHLPTTAPAAAAVELERCVRELGFCGALIQGMTEGKFLDDPSFEPLLAAAEALDVPLYLHPGLPPESVRRAYYDGFAPAISFALALPAWGWHAETALHVLRLVISGAFDRHPGLRLIIGHMGEGLATGLDRASVTLQHTCKHLKRSVSETVLDQVFVTTSGFFTMTPFHAALATFGADRILFSVDYPFGDNRVASNPNRDAREFLDALPVSEVDREKIAHGNADRLLKLSSRAAAPA